MLVLNNGILMNAATSWMYQTPALATHYRVLHTTAAGKGSRIIRMARHMDQHASDLAELLAALDVDRAHIAGISYGGEVAQTFALAHPSRVRSLILCDTVSEVGAELRLIVEAWRDRAVAGDADGCSPHRPRGTSRQDLAAHPEVVAAARQRYRLLDLPAVARLCDAFLGSI